MAVPYLKLSVDWMDFEIFDDATDGERLAWVSLLCCVKELHRNQPVFDSQAFADRYRLDGGAVDSMVQKAIARGELRFNSGRVVITNWRNWGKRRTKSVPSKVRKHILSRDSHLCRYCGEPAGTVDHVLPQSRGGTDESFNLVACCLQCNSRKHAMTPEEAGMALRGLDA